MFKNALVSVSDKNGLADFICPLFEQGMRVVSTGGTASFLKKAGVSVEEISQQTGFKEVMDGRVKSLHPHIYIPLLARLNHKEDSEVLKQMDLLPFDLVVCNLYPFKEKRKLQLENLMEWVDVGGPSLLRASAKNFERVTVLCDPIDYSTILKEGKPPNLNKRKQLAGKVFSLLSDYNKDIADYLFSAEKEEESRKNPSEEKEFFLEKEVLKARFFKSLRYGENPSQKAAWFQQTKEGLHQATCLQGKELSYNNISDLNSAVSTVSAFSKPCVVSIKHNNPCGVACAKDIPTATEQALKADPISVFGAVVALNQEVDEKTAEMLCSLFLEAVIAPDYSSNALSLFKAKKKNLRVIKYPSMLSDQNEQNIRSVKGGFLMQEPYKLRKEWPSEWKVIGELPSEEVKSDLLMAWKVCAHLKSNAIALVSQGQTVGLGMGQVSRVSAVELALQQWKTLHPKAKKVVMASDGFFPFSDSVEKAGQAGIKWIIQPGGSLRDKEVLAKAKELSVNMILTGERCFLH